MYLRSSSAWERLCVSHHMLLDAEGVGFEFLSPSATMWLLGQASVFSRVFKRWNKVKDKYNLFPQIVQSPSSRPLVWVGCVQCFLHLNNKGFFLTQVVRTWAAPSRASVFLKQLIGVMNMIIAPPGPSQAGWNILRITSTCNLLRFLCSECKGQMGQFETVGICLERYSKGLQYSWWSKKVQLAAQFTLFVIY